MSEQAGRRISEEEDDSFIRVFDLAVVPLPPIPGTFERVARRARRRRILRSCAAVTSAAAAVAAVGLAGIEARHVAERLPETAQSMSPQPSVSSAATPPCSSAALAVTPGDQVAGPTRIGFTLVVVNRSGGTCTITGYPSVTIRALAGPGTPLVAANGGTSLAGDPSPHAVTLLPGASAVAEVEWSTPGRGCQGTEPGGIQVDVTVPGGASFSGERPLPKGCVPADPAATALRALTNALR